MTTPLTQTQPYKMGVHEAKRWAKDSMGFDVVRAMVRDGKLLNKTWDSTIKVDYVGLTDFTFISVGNSTLVLNHTDREIYIQH